MYYLVCTIHVLSIVLTLTLTYKSEAKMTHFQRKNFNCFEMPSLFSVTRHTTRMDEHIWRMLWWCMSWNNVFCKLKWQSLKKIVIFRWKWVAALPFYWEETKARYFPPCLVSLDSPLLCTFHTISCMLECMLYANS